MKTATATSSEHESPDFGPTPGWRMRILGNYFQKWLILGALIGVVAGLGSIVFFKAIELATQFFLGTLVQYTPPVPRGEGVPVVEPIGRPWMLPVVTTIGGLISGLIVFTFAPEAEGHGTDAAIQAFHERGGRIRGRIPPVKLVASAVTIGSGGSAGREGPTAQIAAGFGSWLGGIFQLSEEDRRIALAVGVGAGIGAIFKAPLGGAILAGEILYVRDFEFEAIVPGFIASVIGYSIFASWSGWTPVFGSGLALEFAEPRQLLWYAVLGLAAGLVGLAYVKVFYGVRDLSARVELPRYMKPAIGGLLVGVMALVYPEVLSMGYGWLQFAIEGNTAQLAVSTMLVLVALKILATSFTIGTGGSGGVFAPGLFIGGMLGGAMWGALHAHVGWMPANSAPFVIVGMMALFGGVAHAPLAVMLMVAEMTGEFSMIVPAMVAVGIAYFIVGNVSIYENQLATRKESPAHRDDYTVSLLETIDVGSAMSTDVVTASPGESCATGERRMVDHGLRALPVVVWGRLTGMFTMSDALLADRTGKSLVGEAMTSDALIVAHADDSLELALQRMAERGISRLPVVAGEDDSELVGILTLQDIGAVLNSSLAGLSRSAPGTTGGKEQEW